MDMQDIKLDLIKANIVAKKRKEDLAILLIDTSEIDDDVKAWCAAQCATILAESRAPPVVGILYGYINNVVQMQKARVAHRW
jgi:hypothetical protein